ncbi:MAG: TRAP transporter small permease subunit [Saprospiraceae bacterium]
MRTHRSRHAFSKILKQIRDGLQSCIDFFGSIAAYTTLFLVFVICIDVFSRYVFHVSYNWVLELEWHLFGLIFLLGAASTLKTDNHVRVDVFYTKWSQSVKNKVNILGTVFLLIPWCLVGIATAYKYAINSWFMRESSPNPNGIPLWYPIKFVIVIGFVLLLLQGILSLFEINTEDGD